VLFRLKTWPFQATDRLSPGGTGISLGIGESHSSQQYGSEPVTEQLGVHHGWEKLQSRHAPVASWVRQDTGSKLGT
jgi:hypothetical protein